MAIRDGDVVYIRARATKGARVYENGTEVEGVVVQPMDADGTMHDHVSVPRGTLMSKDKIMWLAERRVREQMGLEAGGADGTNHQG